MQTRGTQPTVPGGRCRRGEKWRVRTHWGASLSMDSHQELSYITLFLKPALMRCVTVDFYIARMKSMHLDTRVLENSILKLGKSFHDLSCLFMTFHAFSCPWTAVPWFLFMSVKKQEVLFPHRPKISIKEQFWQRISDLGNALRYCLLTPFLDYPNAFTLLENFFLLYLFTI